MIAEKVPAAVHTNAVDVTDCDVFNAVHTLPQGLKEPVRLLGVLDAARVHVRVAKAGEAPAAEPAAYVLTAPMDAMCAYAPPIGSTGPPAPAVSRSSVLRLLVAFASHSDAGDWVFALALSAAARRTLPIAQAFWMHPFLFGWAVGQGWRMPGTWPWMFQQPGVTPTRASMALSMRGQPIGSAAAAPITPTSAALPAAGVGPLSPDGAAAAMIAVTNPASGKGAPRTPSDAKGASTKTRTRRATGFGDGQLDSAKPFVLGAAPSHTLKSPTHGSPLLGDRSKPAARSDDLLGEGAFGRVVRSCRPTDGAPTAMKLAPLPPTWNLSIEHGPIPRDVERRWKVFINELCALERVRWFRALLADSPTPTTTSSILFPCAHLLDHSCDIPASGAASATVVLPLVAGKDLWSCAEAIRRGEDVVLPVLPPAPPDASVHMQLRVPAGTAAARPPVTSESLQLSDWCEGVDGETGPRALCEAAARLIVRDITLALHMLHLLGIVHRDVKPENVQIVATHTSSGLRARAVLLDLGFAHVIHGPRTAAADVWTYADDFSQQQALQTLFGTKHAAAPEIWRAADAASAASRAATQSGAAATPGARAPESQYTAAVDVWGLGVVMYAALLGEMPFDDTGGAAELKSNICSGKFRKPEPGWSRLSRQAQQLLSRLFTVEPAERPTLAAVLTHPWVRGDDY